VSIQCADGLRPSSRSELPSGDHQSTQARHYDRCVAHEAHNFLVNDIFARRLALAAKAWASGRMLDVGCGTKPYVAMFRPYVDEHVGLDLATSPHGVRSVDLVGTAYEIPVEDGSFDTVLCTFVLEHLEEPAHALREAYRVLRPGGVAIYGVPFIWHLHEEPRDFFRYSKYGLRYLFEHAGFEIRELEALAGFWVTVGQLFAYYVNGIQRGPLRAATARNVITSMIQRSAQFLDRLHTAEAWTWAYLVVATRRSDDPSVRAQ
jgi:ubiquinone/menaquinone biosynthesis C-methylase UbiE